MGNTNDVFSGGPEVTGAILSAELGTAFPAKGTHTTVQAFAFSWNEFKDSGFANEDGLTITQDTSWEKIKEWGGKTVKRMLSEFDGTLALTLLELNAVNAGNVFGPENVEVVEATADHGFQMAIAANGSEVAPKVWAFKMKAGKQKVLVTVPNGQITTIGDLSFTRTGATSIPVTIETIPDELGNNFYIFTDNGVIAVSLKPTLASVLPSGAATGSVVTIKGTRFAGTTGITFGGVAVASTDFQVSDDGKAIVTKVPAGSAGNTPVIVTNAAGASAARNYTHG